MPYVDLMSADDYASIWYITNSRFGNVGSFDPEKPTINILHPTFLDSTWLDSQFGDPRLDSSFNIIAFDMRVCGRSSCRPNGLHDSWVDAADLAFAHHMLHLPPCHIFALESISVNCAVRFAALFPEMCLSLTLCNVPPPTEVRWVLNAYDEILHALCFAQDLDSYEHAAMEASTFLVGKDCDSDLQDDLIAYWETYMPPFRRQRTVQAVNVLMNRTPVKPHILSTIRQPVLIVQGELSETCPLKYAEKFAAELVNAEGGAILYTVKGASGCLGIIPSNASITNQVFVKFVSRLKPRARSDIIPPETSLEDRMRGALDKLSSFVGDPGISQRDPCSPLSFSCVSHEVSKSQTDALQLYGKDQAKAYSPLRQDGRPIRKFSDRKERHWFYGERDGISYAESTLVSTPKRAKREQVSLPEILPPRKASHHSSPIEKAAIKGSITKAENPTTYSLQRVLA